MEVSSGHSSGIDAVGLIKHLELVFGMIAIARIVGSLCPLGGNGFEFIVLVCVASPRGFTRHVVRSLVGNLLAVKVGTAVATAVILVEDGSCGIGGHGLAITNLGAAAILFGHQTVVDRNIDAAIHGVVGIDATTIELTDDGMVNLEIHTVLHRLHARTCHDAKATAIGVTMWIVIIGSTIINVGSVKAREIELGELAAHDAHCAMSGDALVAISCMASRSETPHPNMPTHDDVPCGLIRGIATSAITYNLLKFSSIEDKRLLMVIGDVR